MPVANAKSERRLYWAKAERFQLANWIPEKKSTAGDIIQASIPIQFQEHIYATDDPKQIAHIEHSKAFKVGRIKLCKDENEAQVFSHAHRAARAGVVVARNEMDKDMYQRVG